MSLDPNEVFPPRIAAAVAALNTGAQGSAAVQVQTFTLTTANVVALGASTTGAFTGTALPTGARIVGCVVKIATAYAGTTTLKCTLGDGTTVDKYLGATPQSLQATAGEYVGAAGSATYLLQNIGGVTPKLTLTSTGTNLSTVSAGAATVELFYIVLP